MTDKQALREAAEKATPGPWEMEQENIWYTDEEGYTKHLVYVQQGDDVDDKQDHYNTAYIAAASPATVLALLDDLEAAEHTAAVDHEAAFSLVEENEEVKRKLAAAEKRMAELESDKSRMMDALHAAVALNSAGISLNDFDECVLRLHEWGALPDYCIALYVDFIHGLVSENKLLDFGYVNDNGAFSLRQAEKRIAEQPSQKRLIGWRASDYTDETSDPELAKNWAAAIGVLPIFEGDVNTKLSAAGIGKGE